MGQPSPLGAAPIPPEIENPKLLGINKEPAHATLMPYASLAEALTAKRHDSSFCRSLNGAWKFHWVERPEQRPIDFYKPDYDVSAWKTIPVPSNWQVLGYGTPYYRNAGYILQKDWPRVMTEPPKTFTAYKERNPVGSYRREFELPALWDGRRIFLTFDGVDSAFFLWVNGQKVGFSVNSRNAAEFDITQYLKPGKNLVAAEVYRFCSGTYLEDQDMWRLSGIFRNVTLWSAPEVHIRDFFAKPDLDAQYRNGVMDLAAKVRNYGSNAAESRKLTVAVYGADSKVVAKAVADVPALAAGEETVVAVKLPVANPAKWTAETPNLYTTVLALGDEAKPGEILSCQTGFRKVEWHNRIFTINGVPVKLKGANRHEHWPDTGHYVTEERMIRDLELLKQANCNHVRTCHYTDDPSWYELCDQWGIYLTAEANLESHGYGFGEQSLSCVKDLEAAHVDRNVANVESVKNHSSVVMWSLGNESGPGPNFVAANAAVQAIDSSRPTHYEGFGIGERNVADVDSQMYPSVKGVEQAAKDPKRIKPYYLCEYVHAMFNSMGSIQDYMQAIDNNPQVMGCAIWEWQDQGLWNKRDPKHPFLAYGGGFGEFPNDHYFIHKGVVFSDRSPKPHFAEVKRAYQWIAISAEDLAAGKVKVRNKYQFIGLEGFSPSWSVTEDGQVIDHGTLAPLELAPGKETVLSVPFKAIAPKPGALYLLNLSFKLSKDELWAKAGYEIAAGQFELPRGGAAPSNATSIDASKLKPLKLDDANGHITVTGAGFSVAFDKTRGVISQMTRDGVGLLAPNGGPVPQFWRSPHRNDDMWAYKQWTYFGLDELKWAPVGISAEKMQNGAARVMATLKAPGKEGYSAIHSAVYTVYGNGTISVDNAIQQTLPHRIPLARMGVRMLLNKKLDQFRYFGRGPMENYSDRKSGSDIGFYASSVREQMTPYAKPMECGNHEDVRWALLSGSRMPGLLAQAEGSVMQVSAIPYTDEEMTPVEYSIDLPGSSATVLHLCAHTSGVGSNGCGPRPLAPYMVWSDPASFSYLLRLLPAGSGEKPAHLENLPERVKPVLGGRDDNDKVKLASQTADAMLEYSLDGKSWQPYSDPIELKTSALIAVRASRKGAQSYQGHLPIPEINRRKHWKVSASSADRIDAAPENAIDGDANTVWHTPWKANGPHHLLIDLSRPEKIARLLYQGRPVNSEGRVKDYEVYLSRDGNYWGPPASKGVLKDSADPQTIELAQTVTARFVKFVALSEAHDKGGVAVAELNIIRAE
jgi:beta-galactosidase